MTLLKPAPTHDLIRLLEPNSLTVDASLPAWVTPALGRAPWVVVRRGHVRENMIPVGVRGAARNERFAALLAVDEIAQRLAPEDLLDWDGVIERARWDATPALAALARVAPLLRRRGLPWGPGGSVGFEIASGAPAATASSDLDLVLRQDDPLEVGEASDLLAVLIATAAPARIDVLLETPLGGVSLAELATARGKLLVRTPDGPRLSADPWMPDARVSIEASS